MYNDYVVCNGTNFDTVCNSTSDLLCQATPQYNIINILPTFVLLLCVSVSGIIGNGLVCVIQVKSRQKTSFGELLLHLAIHDFLSCAILIPSALYMLTGADFIPSHAELQTVCFVGALTLTCSMFTILLIAIDRYLKICTPFHTGISVKAYRYLFFLETGIGMLFALPTLFFENITMYVEEKCCLFRDNSYDSSRWITYNSLMIALFLTVLVVFVWCSWHVAVKVRHRHRIIAPKMYKSNSQKSDGRNRPGTKRAALNYPVSYVSSTAGAECTVSSQFLPIPHRRNAKTAQILLTAGVAFFICWIPSFAIMGYRIEENLVDISALFIKYGDTVGSVMLLCEFWYMLTHAINPVIYAFMERKFRKEILNIFRICKEKLSRLT